MWEYKRKDYKYQLYSELIEQLNKEGEDNWEIVYYDEEKPENYGRQYTVKILFKRQKQIPA